MRLFAGLVLLTLASHAFGRVVPTTLSSELQPIAARSEFAIVPRSPSPTKPASSTTAGQGSGSSAAGAGAGSAKRIQITDEMSKFNGLQPGSEIRQAYETFLGWEVEEWKKSLAKHPTHFLFYSGLKLLDPLRIFWEDFNEEGRKHGELDHQMPRYNLFDTHDTYPEALRDVWAEGLVKKFGFEKHDALVLIRQYVSMSFAIRAAQHGGELILALDKDAPDVPPNRMWNHAEAWMVTAPDTRVERILRYDVSAPKDAPVEVWTKGDPVKGKRLGKKPDLLNPPTNGPTVTGNILGAQQKQG